MKTPFILIFLIMTSLFATDTFADNGTMVLSSGGLTVEVVDPNANPPVFDRGCRFDQAGWIKSITATHRTGTWTPLVCHSVFDSHPAFGIPEELTPSIKLSDVEGDSLQLKLGVGVVRRYGENIFKDSPLRLFPWTVERHGNRVACFLEGTEGCVSYKLRKSLEVLPSGLILVENAMENRGRQPLEFESYLHPFFRLDGEITDWFYAFSFEAEPTVPKGEGMCAIPLPKDQDTFDLIPEGSYAKAWILIGKKSEPGRFMAFKANPGVEKIRFWTKKNRCISMEPFIKIVAPKGTSAKWNWAIKVHCEQ